jgi:hypothetical protein
MCFPSIWVGSQIKHERRITAAFADDDAGTVPDTDNMVSAIGDYRPGDLVLNAYLDNDSWANPTTGKWPVFWRPKQLGGLTNKTWATGYPYRVGDVVRPPTANGYAYRAQTHGTSGSTPSWSTTLGGETSDGAVTWKNIGADSDGIGWVPLVIESPQLFELNVGAGGTFTLNEGDSAHARFKFSGNPGAAVTVELTAGCATGWVRAFLNACGQQVTVQHPNAPGATVQIPATSPPSCYAIFSDGTNCYHVT